MVPGTGRIAQRWRSPFFSLPTLAASVDILRYFERIGLLHVAHDDSGHGRKLDGIQIVGHRSENRERKDRTRSNRLTERGGEARPTRNRRRPARCGTMTS